MQKINVHLFSKKDTLGRRTSKALIFYRKKTWVPGWKIEKVNFQTKIDSIGCIVNYQESCQNGSCNSKYSGILKMGLKMLLAIYYFKTCLQEWRIHIITFHIGFQHFSFWLITCCLGLYLYIYTHTHINMYMYSCLMLILYVPLSHDIFLSTVQARKNLCMYCPSISLVNCVQLVNYFDNNS